jgi:monothiol glutaredoxin
MDTIEKIKQQISENPIILYMKGSPKLPQCGFSSRAAQFLNACEVEYATVDVLANPDIRQTLPQYANWPTFPQLWVRGELVGGSDIIQELYESGELAEMLNQSE